LDQINAGKPITITNPDMTRFMMTLSDAVNLVLFAFEHGHQGDLFVQKAPAATIDCLADAVLDLTKSKVGKEYIGTRHGEKLYETLVTSEEMQRAIDEGNFFRVPADNRDLNYDKYIEKGNHALDQDEPYTSHNTSRLDLKGMERQLLRLDLFADKRPAGWHE
jgi:UDP-glucose 4-epimerase